VNWFKCLVYEWLFLIYFHLLFIMISYVILFQTMMYKERVKISGCPRVMFMF